MQRPASSTSRLVADFEMVCTLGTGEFGTVYRARNKKDRCEYAIRRIYLPRPESEKEKVFREVRALANLDMRFIVRYYSSWVDMREEVFFGNPVERLYIQMELCKTSLKDWLETNRERNKEIIKHRFHQIACGVDYIHSEGLMHRNLKVNFT